MMLSLFIRNKEFHISIGEVNDIYKVKESREMADNVPLFLKDSILKTNFSNFDTVIYSAGPASFTTVRIINSVLKGLLVVCPDLKFIGVSNFLTYMEISSESSVDGVIAIPTMRGDYFCCEYSNKILKKSKILILENIQKYSKGIYFDSDSIYDNINLSELQKSILNTSLAVENPEYIKNFLEIDYGFTPEYKY